MSYRVSREKSLATMLKTTLPSLAQAVTIQSCVSDLFLFRFTRADSLIKLI